MGIVLRKRQNSDGTTSLRLDIHHKGRRWIETLNIKLYKASNPGDRQKNQKNLELAKAIINARERQLASQGHDVPNVNTEALVLDWMQTYIDKYKKKDVRNMQGAKKRFDAFLKESRIKKLTFSQITEVDVHDFWEYLRERSRGEGASSYFNRFKKMMKRAYSEGLMQRNVAADVMAKGGGESAKKDVLTLQEVQALANTPTVSSEVKRAFLFSCVTGLRFIDISALSWENIDTAEQVITIKQSKTGRSVMIPLNTTALNLLGEPGKGLVFNLPSANGCNKTLKAWVKRAGIKKNITWHNARHSFGTNLILQKHDIVTTSKLLGHTTLRHTQRYVDSAAELKRAAVDSLKIDL